MLIFWIGVIIATVFIEIITPTTLVTIWFAVGGLVALIMELIGLSEIVQVIIFFIVSVLTLVIGRPYATEYLRGNTVPTNADRILNDVGIVIKEIKDGNWGEIKVKNTVWSAVEVDGKDIEKDKKVRIIAIEGAKALVKEIND